MIFDLLEHEGLCLGGSSGINVAGAIRMAREMGPGHTIVTMLCDYGNRYQSKLFNPEFLKGKGLPAPRWLTEKRDAIRGPVSKMSDHRFRRMAGSSIWTKCAWWMPPGTCPPTSAIPRRNSRPAHIPGAVFYDIDALSDQGTALPHMLPPPEQFARDAGALGIGDDDMVVVYDGDGNFFGAAGLVDAEGDGP